MKNSDQPEFSIKPYGFGAFGGLNPMGLTKREYFAAMAISAGKSAKEALSLADETLELLEYGESKKTNE